MQDKEVKFAFFLMVWLHCGDLDLIQWTPVVKIALKGAQRIGSRSPSKHLQMNCSVVIRRKIGEYFDFKPLSSRGRVMTMTLRD